MNELSGKVAIVTGGASGIGAATVRRFVEAGARVLVADVQDERGAALAAELGPNATYLNTDVTLESAVQAAVAHAVERFGRLDCIFNNAGSSGVPGPIAEIPAQGYDDTMALLLRSVFLGVKHAAPILARQGSGSIINTASVAGLQTGFGPHIYSAAKAAVIHLTRSVAMELGERGVRVNCICPGGIATPIFGKALGFTDAAADRTVALAEQMLAAMQPIKRAGLPADVAEAALWLASDASTFVNGHALVVDGGLTGGRQWSEVQQRRTLMAAAFEAQR
jgi:NAD(P)-dependent dehydrogenase (short-subunit alcohol dehydrogenase family)